MKGKSILLLLAPLAAITMTAQAANDFSIFWNFDDQTLTPTSVTLGVPFSVSAISVNTGALNVETVANNATYHIVTTAAATTFDPGANRTLWTVSPTIPLLDITVTNVSFTARRANSGPLSWRLVANCNGTDFTIAEKTNALPAITTWYPQQETANTALSTANPVTFKLYGFDCGSSGSVNWRVDDLKISGFVGAPVPVLTPPVLSASNIAADSVTVAWQAVALATGGYLFDASVSPDFGTPGSTLNYAAATSAGTTNGWNASSLGFTSAPVGLILNNGITLTSDALDLAPFSNAQFSFNARYYNSGASVDRTVGVYVSTNAADWSQAELAGSLLATTNQNPLDSAVVNLAPWCGKVVYLRLKTGSSTAAGAAVCNLRVESLLPSFLPGYENRAVASTGITIPNLAPLSTYYFRARSVGAASATTGNSAVLAVKTLSLDLDPATGLVAANVKHNAATLGWNNVVGAAGYEIELCKTNAFLNVNEPRVIITKLFYSGNNRAIELTNVGQGVANLDNYYYKRWRLSGTTDNDWRTAANFSSFNVANGASRMLGAGESILIVHDNSNLVDTHLLNAKSLTSNNGELGWSNDNRIGIFLKDTDALVDTVVTQTGYILLRSLGVSEGATVLIRVPAAGSAPSEPQEYPGQWVRKSGYNGTNAATYDLAPHYVYIDVFPSLPASNATTFTVADLKPYTAYFFRVRGVNGGVTGPWSTTYASFLTPAPPKGTVFMVR